MERTLFHITTKELWSKAQRAGIYENPSLAEEGFIHASFEEQVQGTLDKHFQGQQDLLLLKLSPDDIAAEIKIEDLYNSGQQFPHIYGPIDLAAVISVQELG